MPPESLPLAIVGPTPPAGKLYWFVIVRLEVIVSVQPSVVAAALAMYSGPGTVP